MVLHMELLTSDLQASKFEQKNEASGSNTPAQRLSALETSKRAGISRSLCLGRILAGLLSTVSHQI